MFKHATRMLFMLLHQGSKTAVKLKSLSYKNIQVTSCSEAGKNTRHLLPK